MVIRTASSRNFATNSLFPILAMVFFGWGLLHVWGMEFRARPILHLLFALPGLALSGIALHRYRKHWPVSVNSLPEGQGEKKTLTGNCRAIARSLLLAPVGFVLALFAEGGSFVFMTLAASGMIVIPWARIPACRNHFFMSLMSVEGGAALGLAVMSGPAHPFALLGAALVCLTVSTVALLVVGVVHGNRSDRMPAAGVPGA